MLARGQRSVLRPAIPLGRAVCRRNQTFLRVVLPGLFRVSFDQSTHFHRPRQACGDEGTRTPGLCLAKAPLSQLSYVPGPACGSDPTRTGDLSLIRRVL